MSPPTIDLPAGIAEAIDTIAAASAVLPVNEEDERLVTEMMARQPEPTIKRRLVRRIEK